MFFKFKVGEITYQGKEKTLCQLLNVQQKSEITISIPKLLLVSQALDL